MHHQPASLIATELVYFVQLARLATRSPIRPRRVVAPVELTVPRELTRFFGVPISRGPTELVFSADDAARPFLTVNHAMWSFFEPQLQRRLDQLDADASMAERTQATLLELLPAGSPSLAMVARKLNTSVRSLQRALANEDDAFQPLLDRTREALARHYLSRSTMKSAEIAFLLGFKDPNSFARAFRQWTGKTPEGVRRKKR